MAGIALGLLTYKPHFGLLFPVVLAVAGEWRVMAGAAVTALVLGGATSIVFGAETWWAFAQMLAAYSDLTLAHEVIPWGVFQTTFGSMRWIGAAESIAWATHVIIALGISVLVCLIWRGT